MLFKDQDFHRVRTERASDDRNHKFQKGANVLGIFRIKPRIVELCS